MVETKTKLTERERTIIRGARHLVVDSIRALKDSEGSWADKLRVYHNACKANKDYEQILVDYGRDHRSHRIFYNMIYDIWWGKLK